MRLAILGGSFNPIHLGHLFLADIVLSSLHYDRVVMVPAFRSPFKLNAVGMENSANDRLEMIALAIAGDPRLSVDNCEIRREGVSYTIDTVADIVRRYQPEGKPGLIIGDDLAADFPTWHESDKILAMADVIIARREHSQSLEVPYPSIQIANDIMDISSRKIRERIAKGGAWRGLVPSPVQALIEDRRLYIAAKEGSSANDGDKSGIFRSILRVERSAAETLSFDRFLHSRNTALFAWDMCRRLQKSENLDPDLGYLAGIAHDLGKQLNNKVWLRMAKKDGVMITRLHKEKPSLLHGKAASLMLRERFKIENPDVLEAVAMHTQPRINMCALAKVIYIADKLEVSREKADPALRELAMTSDDLDGIFFAVLENAILSLNSRKQKLSEETSLLLEKMKRMQ